MVAVWIGDTLQHEYLDSAGAKMAPSPSARKTRESDEVLIRRAQMGCSQSFERLARRLHAPMNRFFFRATGDLETAEDLCQELYLRLCRYRSCHRADCALAPWLYAIARNVVHRHWHNKRAAPGCTEVEIGEDEALLPESLFDPSPSATALAQQNETVRFVQSMLMLLAPHDQRVILLRFLRDLTFREIAENLGIRPTAAKLRLYRAVKRLRVLIERRGLTKADFL